MKGDGELWWLQVSTLGVGGQTIKGFFILHKFNVILSRWSYACNFYKMFLAMRLGYGRNMLCMEGTQILHIKNEVSDYDMTLGIIGSSVFSALQYFTYSVIIIFTAWVFFPFSFGQISSFCIFIMMTSFMFRLIYFSIGSQRRPRIKKRRKLS